MRLRIEATSYPGIEAGALDLWLDGEVAASGMARTFLGMPCPDPDTGESLTYHDGARWLRAMEQVLNSDPTGMWVATLEEEVEASTPALVAEYVRLRRELKARGILRADRSLVGELAEHIAERDYDVSLDPNLIRAGFDGRRQGKRVQIKARIVRSPEAPTSWDFGRRPRGFDELLAFLFDPDHRVQRVFLIPFAFVTELAVRNKDRWRLRYNRRLREDSRVVRLL